MSYSTAADRASQHLNSRSNPDNHLAQHSSRILLAGTLLLVGASAALGSYFGYVVGSQQHVLLGLVFAGAALGGEIVKPYAVNEIVSALSRWHVIRALACFMLASVCVVYSFTAELSLAATTRGDLAASREAAVDAIRDARADRARAETELGSLPPTRPAAELQSEIDGLLQTPGAKGCTKIDGRVQETVCPKVIALKIEKARAERRVELEAVIASSTRPVSERPVVRDADPLAGAVATYAAALGWKLDTRTMLPWLALVPVLFLELGSALAVVVVRGVNVGPAALPAVAEPQAVQALPASVVQKRSKPKPKDRRPPSGPSAPGPHKRGLAATLKVLQGGAVQGSQRALAQAIGTSKSTVQRALALLDQPRFAAA